MSAVSPHRYFPPVWPWVRPCLCTMMWSNAGRFVTGGPHSDENEEVFASSESSAENGESSGPILASPESSEESAESAESTSFIPCPPSTLLLSRRSASFGVSEQVDTQLSDKEHRCETCRDISVIQKLWSEHACEAGALYPPALWHILKALLGVPKITQSKVLQACDMHLYAGISYAPEHTRAPQVHHVFIWERMPYTPGHIHHDIPFRTYPSGHTYHDIPIRTYLSRHTHQDIPVTTYPSRHIRHTMCQAVVHTLPKQEREHWPKTRRQIDEKMMKRVGSFHPRVTRRVSIDLSHIGLPGLHKPIVFTFVDPVFAWSVCADKLSGNHDLYFLIYIIFF